MAQRSLPDLAQLAVTSSTTSPVEQFRAHLLALITRLDEEGVLRLWRFVGWWVSRPPHQPPPAD